MTFTINTECGKMTINAKSADEAAVTYAKSEGWSKVTDLASFLEFIESDADSFCVITDEDDVRVASVRA